MEQRLGGGAELLEACMIGCEALEDGRDCICGVSTALAHAFDEESESEAEIRAYKLGKHKCSYNQVNLTIRDVIVPNTELRISEAVDSPVGEEVNERLRESCLKFDVHFTSGNSVNLYVLLVFSCPPNNRPPYRWCPVTRTLCKKRCTGPVLRGLQRFGTMKEPRHLYIAIDEASTHLIPTHDGEAPRFRFLIVIYDNERQLLGSAVSRPIRVLANNDTPLGAASLEIHCNINASGMWRLQTQVDRNSSQETGMPLSDMTNRWGWLRKCSKLTPGRSLSYDGAEELAAQKQEEEPKKEPAKLNEEHQKQEPEVVQTRSFEPFQYLESLFTAKQIDYLQKQNPAFLFNFVRYSRELYNKFCRDCSQEVTRPTPKRPLPSACIENTRSQRHFR